MSIPKKKYAVAIDVSPSEQLTGNPNTIFSMGMLFGLYSRKSFDLVGRDFADDPLTLKKWASGSIVYREKFVRHAHHVVENAQVICGVNRANERHVRTEGKRIFEHFNGSLPQPSSFNKKGRARIRMGGYKIDGKPIPPYEVLRDDLFVIGWLAESCASCLRELDRMNEEPVGLDVLSDRLPNEQGGESYHKATLFKSTLEKATDGRANVVGVADPKMETQLELFVDNLAGLARQIYRRPDGTLSKFIAKEELKIFAIERTTI